MPGSKPPARLPAIPFPAMKASTAKPKHPPMTPAKRKTFAEDLLNSKSTAELKMGIASILKEEADASKILTLAYQLEERVNNSEPVKQLLRKAIADAEKRAQMIADEIKANAQAEANRIISQAKADAEQQVTKAREELRAQVAGLAVKGAEQILKREVNAAAHADLLSQLAVEL